VGKDEGSHSTIKIIPKKISWQQKQRKALSSVHPLSGERVLRIPRPVGIKDAPKDHGR